MPPMRRPRNRAARLATAVRLPAAAVRAATAVRATAVRAATARVTAFRVRVVAPVRARARVGTRLRAGALLAALLPAGLLAAAPLAPAAASAATAADLPGLVGRQQLVSNGDPSRRITLVLIGDGYTAAELPVYHRQAAAVWQALTQVEPFRTYQRFFDVTRVDVVSPTSGLRAGSPLGMHFGCDGLPRLLCADDRAVTRYAGRSGGRQYVVALANSCSYGGEGGNGLATLAAGSPEAARIVQHELGHSVGALGDEYDAAPADPGFPNLAAEDAATLRRDHLKWWRWLGAADPTGGTVGAYRGANGLYRPTRDSIMRTLGGVYNLPSREALIESLYRRVWPIDRTQPAPGAVTDAVPLRVFPVPLVGPRQLAVTWTVDGRPAPPQAVGANHLDTARLGLGSGQRAEVSATVSDTTPWLRDEAFRRERMTGTVSWSVQG
jgi:IgA Peptidase M64